VREYDPEDTIRFYSLVCVRPVIKSAPKRSSPGHRLALPQRAEEGAEGMNTRREFLQKVTVAERRSRGVRPCRVTAEPHRDDGTPADQVDEFVLGASVRGRDLLKRGFTHVSYIDMPLGSRFRRC